MVQIIDGRGNNWGPPFYVTDEEWERSGRTAAIIRADLDAVYMRACSSDDDYDYRVAEGDNGL